MHTLLPWFFVRLADMRNLGHGVTRLNSSSSHVRRLEIVADLQKRYEDIYTNLRSLEIYSSMMND